MKIAIIGAGISGLTVASVLSARHEVSVFEAESRIGGHTNTITVPDNGRVLGVDTGFIVFNEPNYPNFIKLLSRHEVAIQDSDMSFSVHNEVDGVEYNGTSFDALFAQRSNLLRPKFWAMLNSIVRFHKEAQRHLVDGLSDYETVTQYVSRNNYPLSFFERYLVPLGASLWSCDAARFSDFPIRFVLEFLNNHHMLQVDNRPMWKTICGGSHAYVEKLVEPLRNRVYTGCPVANVVRQHHNVEVRLRDGRVAEFDEVVLATHADQSIAVVSETESRERDVLEAFPYQSNDVILHTDVTVLPDREKIWASWNYRIPSDCTDRVTVTYNMNKLQKLDAVQTYCVSLNQHARIDPGKVLKRIRYDHPLFLPGRRDAQNARAELIRRRGLSYCGAYWGYGFHEDGVSSALDVCRAFDMDLDS